MTFFPNGDWKSILIILKEKNHTRVYKYPTEKVDLTFFINFIGSSVTKTMKEKSQSQHEGLCWFGCMLGGACSHQRPGLQQIAPQPLQAVAKYSRCDKTSDNLDKICFRPDRSQFLLTGETSLDAEFIEAKAASSMVRRIFSLLPNWEKSRSIQRS